ncbi:MAG: cytochrome P450 [Gemmatimonadetes bacterium]|nr:cytochrome P450 [Gemmatimonadota bacterium]MCY3611891.1 cytochrome P450 [Gemmatimonadota bacterium]
MIDRATRFPLGARVDIQALADDPYPIFHELRRTEPVTWAPALGMWLLTRRDDIVRVLADWERFTTDSPVSTIRDIFGSNMLTTDGEEQIRYKRRFIGPFRRGKLEENLLGTVQGVLDELMGDLEAGSGHSGAHPGRADLRARIARPLSVRSICRVLGLPEEDGPRLLHWYDHFAAALENFAGEPAVRAAGKGAAREFRDYVTPFLRGERAVPQGSMVAALQSERDPHRPDRGAPRGWGDPLLEADMVANLLLVLFGGIETTESMIGNALWAVLSHPEVAERLAAECSGGQGPGLTRAGGASFGVERADTGQGVDSPLLAGVIEESMRWEPAVQSCMRFATEDVEIRGVPIARGETVHCLLGAANRDPAHFPDPDRFDPGRPNARDHLAFGAGRHFCLGASLARIEAEQALARIFGGLHGLRLDSKRPSRPHGHEFRTPPTVWVRWGPSPASIGRPGAGV